MTIHCIFEYLYKIKQARFFFKNNFLLFEFTQAKKLYLIETT